jgi:hypothetical protein
MRGITVPVKPYLLGTVIPSLSTVPFFEINLVFAWHGPIRLYVCPARTVRLAALPVTSNVFATGPADEHDGQERSEYSSDQCSGDGGVVERLDASAGE